MDAGAGPDACRRSDCRYQVRGCECRSLLWEALLRRALFIYENASGSQDRAVGSTLFKLAMLLHKRSRYDEAELLYRRALAICEKAWGPDHPETAGTMGMLARLLEGTGDLIGGRLLLGRAYNISVKTLGESHPSTLTMKTWLNGMMIKSATMTHVN